MKDILDTLDELKAKATKTPLKQSWLDVYGTEAFPYNIAKFSFESDAEFIVTLVNNYEILAARLRAAEKALSSVNYDLTVRTGFHEISLELIKEWRAAKEQGK